MKQEETKHPKVELVKSADGSSTLFVPELNEHYHSVNGAYNESMHVFIKHGLHYYRNLNPKEDIKILEIGFGTGLNALLTFIEHKESLINLTYHTIDPNPIPELLVKQLNYPSLIEKGIREDFDRLLLSHAPERLGGRRQTGRPAARPRRH